VTTRKRRSEESVEVVVAGSGEGPNGEESETIVRLGGNASIVGNSRVVFNIGGNKYRLVVAFKYETRIAFIRFVGTHAAYDRIDVEKV
jgi:mRNA-degrading endonuclease HigB of HigAB toxin-antitoxin module